ncbi:hypothetical protein CS063_14835 [Sporanaerobium hydrogeniformans]|uniref:Uncharacterized protein n=1 Tax=Sporanaerobium hydrogeniformans TaxID=3072179 RepID=A0AC61D7X2_9FIRM|nr:rhodanese-like domain-containing protein [Sporanaerobium hydrogeniformans]PHV69634.1 hypothetical protein CS063_14835 [Sporanaerobium hydrogeniformans]
MKKMIIVLGLSLVMLIGCSNKQSEELQVLTAQEAKAIIDDEEYDVILDVRTIEEYNEGHIEHAILLPDYEIESKIEEVISDKDARILIYCRSGRRSNNAANKLVDLGYTHVYDFGGIIDWPYATVKE